MSDVLEIVSHKGPYQVFFEENALEKLGEQVPDRAHFIVDRNVAALYREALGPVLDCGRVLLIDATEENKSLHRFTEYVDTLVRQQLRRDRFLVAVGGGITQDITCFLASTMLRGVPWHFYPTTLLAQADSCIGSKSSINVGQAKNILGTFTPPLEVHVSTRVLSTLTEGDVRSGIGEMLKAHIIDGPESFDTIAADYERLAADHRVMVHYIHRSLAIKKGYVEADEFDRGVRNVFNYGHSFGHAIEAATDFGIPHGIAVSMGMDMANFVAAGLELTSEEHYARMHLVLKNNYADYENLDVPLELFFKAIGKDKKNIGTTLTLILPDMEGITKVVSRANDDQFKHLCETYLGGERNS